MEQNDSPSKVLYGVVGNADGLDFALQPTRNAQAPFWWGHIATEMITKLSTSRMVRALQAFVSRLFSKKSGNTDDWTAVKKQTEDETRLAVLLVEFCCSPIAKLCYGVFSPD